MSATGAGPEERAALPPGIEIHRYHEADHAAVADLLSSVGFARVGQGDLEGEMAMGGRARVAIAGAATDPRTVVGFAMWARDGRLAVMRRVCVREDLRRRGIGAALVAAIEKSARSHGVRRLVLYADPGDRAAIALYRRAGWRADHLANAYRVAAHPVLAALRLRRPVHGGLCRMSRRL